jgi:hypothetical protein
MKPGETETRLVDSPHARFVGGKENFTSIEEPSPWDRAWTFIKHLLLMCWWALLFSDFHAFSYCNRLFLLNQEAEEAQKSTGAKSQVQELTVWSPREAEKAFFT